MFNPVRTPLADVFADASYSVKPGTDLAIALAIINTILANKKYNLEFLKTYSDAPVLVDLNTKSALKTKDGIFYSWCKTHRLNRPILAMIRRWTEEAINLRLEGKEITAKPVLQLLAETTSSFTPEWAAPISRSKGGR